jgi:hypothetical protein
LELQTRIYRGKVSLKSDWIFGSLLQSKDSDYIAQEENGEVFASYKVLSETVGLCSGILDLSVNFIYEGDKLRSGHGYFYNVKFVNGKMLAYSSLNFPYYLEDIFRPLIVL